MGPRLHFNASIIGGAHGAAPVGVTVKGEPAMADVLTPKRRVLGTMAEWGVSTCSSRSEGGHTPLHAELESPVTEDVPAAHGQPSARVIPTAQYRPGPATHAPEHADVASPVVAP